MIALLVSAYSRYSPALAEELGTSLTTPTSASNTLDVDTLEQMPSFKHSRRLPVKEPSKDKTTPLMKTQRKKKRKPRLPQNYNPNVSVDKERWLPLRERSYFRRGKKKGFIGSGRGSQGASIASASLMAALDANKPKTSTMETTGKPLVSVCKGMFTSTLMQEYNSYTLKRHPMLQMHRISPCAGGAESASPQAKPTVHSQKKKPKKKKGKW